MVPVCAENLYVLLKSYRGHLETFSKKKEQKTLTTSVRTEIQRGVLKPVFGSGAPYHWITELDSDPDSTLFSAFQDANKK